MRRGLILALAAFVLVSGIAVLIAPDATSALELRTKPCKGNAAVVDACFTVHGRYAIYNGGSPQTRIWIIGSKRLLGVGDLIEGEDDPWIPANLKSHLRLGVEIFGDFEVCPLAKEQAGAMRTVCVESASHLVIKDWNKKSDN
jgi:hypothetical protein